MTVAVVDRCEPIHIGGGEHQASGSASSAVDLALNHDHPELATKRAGELIKLPRD